MKISFFNKLKSYLFDVVLETTSSNYNELLIVLISRGRYQLCTRNAIYSFDDLYDNYTRAFEKLPLDNWKVKDVLILGLGLGSIPSMLENKFGLKLNFTAIEIDAEVVHLAHKYVLHDLESPIQVYTTDAAIFLEQNERKFDLICIDVFVDDIIPNKFQSGKFLNQVERSLTDDGWVMYNRLARTKQDKKKSKFFFNNNFKKIFGKATILDVKGNWMFINKTL